MPFLIVQAHLGLSGSQIGNKTEKLVTGRNEPVKTRFLEPDFFKKAFCSSRSREAISASISAQTGTTPAPLLGRNFLDGLIMLVLLEISRNLVLAHVAGINNRLSEMRATSLSSCRRPRRGQMNGRFFRFQGGHKEPLKRSTSLASDLSPFIIFCESVDTAFKHFHIGKNQLEIYGFNVSCGVDRTVHMDNVVVFKAADNMNNGVNLADMGKEFVPQSLAL